MCSDQIRSHHSQDSAVSSQRSGCEPDDPDVWCSRMYLSSGYVRLVPYGGGASWSASSSGLVVSGRVSKSSQPRMSLSRARQKPFVLRTSASPALSFRSCRSRSWSGSVLNCAVADLQRAIEDLEALVQLLLRDAQWRVGHDRVPTDKGMHASVM